MEDWHFGFEFGGALDFRAKRGKLQGDPIPGEMTMPRFVVLLLLLVTVAVTTPIREARAMSSPAPPLAVYRVEALARIAVEQSVAGDTAGAVETIALALEVAEAIADEGDRSEALVHVVWAQAVTGDAAGAFATAEATTDDGDRMRALARAALVFLDAGAKADAVQAVTRLAGAVVNNSNPNGSDHLNMAVTAWLQAMTWDAIGALEAAEAIADNEVRAGTLLAVAVAQAETGDLAGAKGTIARALEAVAAMASADDRDKFLTAAAWVQAYVGDIGDGLETAEAVSRLELRALALSLVATVRARMGDPLGTGETADEALATLERRAWLGLDFKPVSEDVALGHGLEAAKGALLTGLAQDGPAEAAGLVADDIILRFGGNEVTYFLVLTDLLETISAGEAVAVEVWRDGAPLALQIVPERLPEDLAETEEADMIRSAVALAQAGAGGLGAAFDTVETIGRVEARAWTLGVLGVSLGLEGDLMGARTAAALARDAGNLIDKSSDQVAVMGAVVAAWIEVGDLAQALETITAAGDGYKDEGRFLATAAGRLLAGDTTGAAARALDWLSFWKLFRESGPRAPVATAELQARAGDLSAALETAAALGEDPEPAAAVDDE